MSQERCAAGDERASVTAGHLVLVGWGLAMLLGGCSGHPEHAAEQDLPPGRVVTLDGGVHQVELRPEAIRRIRLETAPVEPAETASPPLRVVGVVVAGPGARADVRAPLAGTFLKSQVDLVPGTAVQAGQWLARLLPIVTPQRFVGIEAQAALESAQARVDAAASNAARVARLQKDGSLSARAVEQANADLAATRADLLAAQSRVKQLGNRALDADVVLPLRSPISGVVLSVDVAFGQLVDAATPLFTVIDRGRLQARAVVFGGDLDRLDSAGKVRVRNLAGGDWRDASLSGQPRQGLVASPNVAVLVDLATADAGLALGGRVEVELPTTSPPVVASVKKSAVFYDAWGQPHVYVETAPGRFTRHPVEISAAKDDAFTLSRGPAVGTRVVIVGIPELVGTEMGVGH